MRWRRARPTRPATRRIIDALRALHSCGRYYRNRIDPRFASHRLWLCRWPGPQLVIDPRLLADLKRAEDDKHVEGTDFHAYRDTLGNWTGPYGHLLDQSIDWAGQTWTQATGDSILSADVAERTDQVHTLAEWSALDTDCRRNAIIECVFNLGLKHWITEFPKTRASIRAQSWTVAAANLLASPEWIREVGRSRVARLAGYFASGSYSP